MEKENIIKEDVRKTDFCINGKIREGTLILEKNSISLDDDFTNVIVYELDSFDSEIPFEGTNIDLIKKEFPNFNIKNEEYLSKIYLMYKDEEPFGFDVP